MSAFNSKKAKLPAGARPATRRRTAAAGGGRDEGYTLDGAFYLVDGSAASSSDYCEPAQQTSTGSSYDSGYGSSTTSYDSGSGSSGYDSGSGGSSDCGSY